MTKLISLSSLIPTFVLQENMKRSVKIKQDLDAYIKNMIKETSEAM